MENYADMVDLKRIQKRSIKQKGNSPNHHHCNVDPNPNYLYHCGASGSYHNAAFPMINDRRPPMISSTMIPARSDHVIAFRCIDPAPLMQRLDRPPASLEIESASASASDRSLRGNVSIELPFDSSLSILLHHRALDHHIFWCASDRLSSVISCINFFQNRKSEAFAINLAWFFFFFVFFAELVSVNLMGTDGVSAIRSAFGECA
jgi:hypothetical protein